MAPGHRIQLMQDPGISTLRVAPPVEMELQKQGLMAQQATISINFLPPGTSSNGDTCQTWPETPKASFTYAANIWASLLESSVPITVDVCWSNSLGSGVLGAAGPNNFYRNFTGAPTTNTWFPVALANALSGTDRDPANADIYAVFSSTFNWYYGTDGNTPPSQMDFVSVILHEIGHGLGFTGSMNVSSGQGSWGQGTTSPFRYDRFAENGAGQSLIDTATFPNPSAALAAQLQSNSVFFDGPNANVGNGGSRAPLYAPTTWNGGSSFSHLAESYNNTANALMTFSLPAGESTHHPGSVTLGIFKDLGWTVTTPVSTFSLTVAKSGSGTGTVTSLPAGISCGTTCSASFNSGVAVTLLATPAAGSTFSGWTGACTGTGSCVVTMSANQNVTATFAGADTHGNTIGTAFPVSTSLAGVNTPGSIDSAGDLDFFRIDLSGAGILTVFTSGTTDTLGQLLNSAGTVIASNDDISNPTNRNFLIRQTLAAGTYYVRVSHFSSTGTGSYILYTQFTPSASANAIGALYNIPIPTATGDAAFLRMFNTGAATENVVLTAYDQNGNIMGATGKAVGPKGVYVLSGAELSALLGNALWSGRAWVEVTSSNASGAIKLQNLVRSVALTNMSCVSDRYAFNIPHSSNVDQPFVRIYNTSTASGAVRGTLYSQDGAVLGTPNAVLVSSLPAKAVAVLNAAQVQSLFGAPNWTGRAWIEMTADFGSALRVMNLVRDPSNSLNNMSCIFN